MECEHATELIEAALDRELGADDRTALDGHLAGCAVCRATEEAFRLQDADLRRAFAPRREAAAALGERVGAALAGGEAGTGAGAATGPSAGRRPAGLPPSPLLTAALVGLAAAAGFLLALVVERRVLAPARGPATEAPRAAVLDPAVLALAEQRLAELLDRVATLEQALAAAERDRAGPGGAPQVAALTLATGRVEARAGSDQPWLPLATGAPLAAGTSLRTPAGVRCEVEYACGSLVRLDADTEVSLPAGGRQCDLGAGRVYASVAPAEAPFRVLAASAGAALTALGTAFDVDGRGADLVLTVIEGAVRVEDLARVRGAAGGGEAPAGGGELVPTGEGARISGGRIVERQGVRDLVQATRWVHELLVLKGRDDRELARRVDHLFAQIGRSKLEHLAEAEIRALGDHCVLPLCRFIEEEPSGGGDAHKRRQAARILADISPPWAIPHLIELLSDADGEVRFHAATALRRLTGLDLGRSPARWRDDARSSCEPDCERWGAWWRENCERFPGQGS